VVEQRATLGLKVIPGQPEEPGLKAIQESRPKEIQEPQGVMEEKVIPELRVILARRVGKVPKAIPEARVVKVVRVIRAIKETLGLPVALGERVTRAVKGTLGLRAEGEQKVILVPRVILERQVVVAPREIPVQRVIQGQLEGQGPKVTQESELRVILEQPEQRVIPERQIML
jgi:hypothetical protein